MTDNRNSRVVTVEVSCPFDAFTGQCYTHKRDLYEPLGAEYEANGYDANVIVFIVGSLGSVPKKFVDGFVTLGFLKSQGKEIAKYCSVSSVIGSKFIWNIRCRRKHMAIPRDFLQSLRNYYLSHPITRIERLKQFCSLILRWSSHFG